MKGLRKAVAGIFCILMLIAAVAGTLVMSSCGDSGYEYSNHRCYLVFDNSTHLDPTLSSALVQLSPGTFCRIYKKGESFFYFNSNHGLSSRSAANAVDLKRTCILGVFNESGIIVGYGMLDNPAILYAYDAQCPNCYENTGMPRYTLTMNDAGMATCGSCHRSYDMNNGGVISSGGSGGDRKLMRYRASYSEQTMVLTVGN